MTWTKLGDDFMDRPEIYEASRSARLLHIEALVWSNKRGLDGLIDTAAIARCTDVPDWRDLVTELEESGAWTQVSESSWQLDWSEQEDAADVRARKDARAATQKLYRKRVAAHREGDHSLCDPRRCPALVVGNAPGHETTHKTTPRPVPSLPVPKGQGQGQQGAGPETADAAPIAAQGQERSLPPAHAYNPGPETDCCQLPPEHPIHQETA